MSITGLRRFQVFNALYINYYFQFVRLALRLIGRELLRVRTTVFAYKPPILNYFVLIR